MSPRMRLLRRAIRTGDYVTERRIAATVNALVSDLASSQALIQAGFNQIECFRRERLPARPRWQAA